MTSCSEWTGVLLSTLLKECGLKSSATWFVAEGAEEVKGASSMPIAKAMDDGLIAYGQNGEALRPQQGFPLRIVVPGFEGIFNTKFLRRIKVVDRYFMNYNDFGHLKEDAKEAALGFQIGPKSVITYPSGTQQLPGKGTYEISGLAWSGGGAIKTVEVSTDGGKKWNPAELKMTPQRMAHVRFAYQWNWDGNETEILSRCTDEIGQQQPTLEQVAKFFNEPVEELQRARAQQQRHAVEDRQGREGDQWARLSLPRFCCSWAAPSWSAPRWRSRRPPMAWGALRPQKKSAPGISTSVPRGRNSLRAAAPPRKAQRSLAPGLRRLPWRRRA